MKVGFIGLGNMGTPMAKQLVRAGHEVTAWNRTLSKAEPLKKEGAKVTHSIAEAAKNVEIAITMLADDHAVESAVLHDEGLAQNLPKGALHISMSTVSMHLQHIYEKLHVQSRAEATAKFFGQA